MSAVAAIELRGVTQDFSGGLRGVKLRAVDDLTLRVEPGEIFGLLGPNGSGKSTTIKIILGLIAPTASACEVFGVSSERIEARLAIGYLPKAPDLLPSPDGPGVGSFPRQTLRTRSRGGPGARRRDD